MTAVERNVTLRREQDGQDRRHLWAYLDTDGNLRIDGQDLGPKTAPVSDSGGYEFFQIVRAVDLPQLCVLLGAAPTADVLEVLEHEWSGARSYDLEKLLRESDLEIERFVWAE
ncbi:MAG: hypothetical protein ACYDC5_06635 [Candidatus Dormibacteria bacterium]